MIIEIVGIQYVDYTSKKTGRQVHGQKIFFSYPDDNIRGVGTDSAFLSGSKVIVPEPSIPCTCELYYNKFGNVDEVRIIT